MQHILVVDDNVTNLKVAKAALEGDYKVTILTSGVQVLKFLEKNRPAQKVFFIWQGIWHSIIMKNGIAADMFLE